MVFHDTPCMPPDLKGLTLKSDKTPFEKFQKMKKALHVIKNLVKELFDFYKLKIFKFLS